MRLLGTKHRLHEFVVIGTILKSGSDVQFSFVTIYKVGKCMMPSVSKICPDFKSCKCIPAFSLSAFGICKKNIELSSDNVKPQRAQLFQ